VTQAMTARTGDRTAAAAGAAGGGASGGPALALACRGLTKRFHGGQLAVADLDLVVPRQSVYGFLGPNGSGKTTTIRMLLGLIVPTRGTWEVLGQPMPAAASRVLRRVGALIEGPAFHPYLTGRANLARLDAADSLADPRTFRARIGQALERVGLAAAAGKRYRNYSTGMRQRLGLAAALLQPRELLVLDEPTNGLDPQGTREVRALIRELAREGATVFLSSHLLNEVEQVCSHAGIMSAGRLVAHGSLTELGAGAQPRLRVDTAEADLAVRVLAGLGCRDAQRRGEAAEAVLDGVAPERACAALVGAGVPVRGLAVQRPSLEDTYVSLTGEGFDVNE
jgi:ABC-2 type transport system ATP-binding protein